MYGWNPERRYNPSQIRLEGRSRTQRRIIPGGFKLLISNRVTFMQAAGAM